MLCVEVGAGEGREKLRMTPRFLKDGGATTGTGRQERSRLDRGCVVGRFRLATPISHLGEMSGNESVGLPAGQSWGSTPLSLAQSGHWTKVC